ANDGGEPAEVEGPEVRIEILNADGEVVRTLPDPDEGLDEDVPGDRPWGHLDPLPAKPGVNRVVWDLRHRPSKLPRLRTKPLEASQTALPDRGWRPLVEGSRIAPLAAPGSYTVRLTVDGQGHEQPLTIIKDPHSAGTVEEVVEQVDLVLQLRSDLDQVVEMINEIEWIRRQLSDLRSRLASLDEGASTASGAASGSDSDGGAAGDTPHQPVIAAAAELDEQFQSLEGRFFDLRLTGGNAFQDTLRWPRRLYSKLGSLAGYIHQSDFPATDQQVEVHGLYQDQITQARSDLDALLVRLKEFNQTLSEAKLSGVISNDD
ncbi:MAG TPA: hypothetical protein VLV83_00165, partial [Acidobacteriota bacterium]|nr:hypothetical protein [Acidobacteriota bacterium]